MFQLRLYLLLLVLFLLSCQQQQQSPKPSLDLSYAPDSLEIFGENFISTGLVERDIAISPDGNLLIYTLGNHKQSLRCLVKVEKINGTWSDKQILSFSGKYQDIEPFFSPDGQSLFFASNRPLVEGQEAKDYNIWKINKTETGWGEAIALDSTINSTKDEFYPSVTKDGHLYFTATRADGIGREDIFRSEWLDGRYQMPIPLDSNINTKVYEFNAYVNPDDNLIIFSSYGRKDGMGGSDLYYSQKDAQGNWLASKNMGSFINSKQLDYCPFIDYPRGNFYFTSERVEPFKGALKSVQALQNQAHQALNGMGNIYRIKLDALKLN